MADILLTHSYHLAYDAKQLRKMQPYAPLGTLYAASALRQKGFTVAVFDSMLNAPEEHFEAALRQHRPRIVAVYEDDFNFLSKMCLTRMREVAWDISAAARAAGATVIVHGSDSTDHPELFLRHGYSYVLCGEAEATLVELCSAILRRVEVIEIDGLLRLNTDGSVLRSKARLASNPSWTELPVPARDLIDLEPYRRAWTKAHGYFSTNMVSGRGCPYHCNWCAKPISGNKYHLRPAVEVAEEMKQLKAASVEHIWFGDDVFALNHHWLEQFADEVEIRNAAIPFKIQSRADLMTMSTVQNLRRSGCAEVWMGVESGSQAILNAMEKGLTLASIVAARSRLKAAGIRACYFLQFGYPGENWARLQETIAFVRSTRPDDIGISFSYPLPGTAFYERVQTELGRKRNWTDSDDLCIMFKAAYTTDFYRAVRDALHAEVSGWTDAKVRPRAVAALWCNVEELEPVSRQNDALILPEKAAASASGLIMPMPALSPAREM